MSEKHIDNIIKEVNATMGMEGQNLKSDEKISLRRTIIKNFKKLKSEIEENGIQVRRKK